MLYFGIVHISLCTTVWKPSFYLLKRASLCSRYGLLFFCYTFTYFVRFGVIENRVTKINTKYFKEIFDHSICPGWSVLPLYAPTHRACFFEKLIFELDEASYSFKITCIPLRKVISFEKIAVMSAKLTILISWSAICIPFILLLVLMKLESTPAAIMYNSIENRHPWQTPWVRVKGSDRRPFILTLDWILMYSSSTTWMNLSPYPNLWKAEKLKSQ